jgi:hypothetical protein
MAARKRAPRSPIAKDPDRALIERALALGEPMVRIAKRFGYTVSSIHRYKRRLAPQLQAAIAASVLKPKEGDLDKLRIEESEGLLGNLAAQRARLLLTQDRAIEDDDRREVGYISRVIHENIELTGKYLGIFSQHQIKSTTNVNLLVTEDYLRIRQVIEVALRPFPEARRAVYEAMHKIESEAAQDLLAGRQGPAPVIEHETKATEV